MFIQISVWQSDWSTNYSYNQYNRCSKEIAWNVINLLMMTSYKLWEHETPHSHLLFFIWSDFVTVNTWLNARSKIPDGNMIRAIQLTLLSTFLVTKVHPELWQVTCPDTECTCKLVAANSRQGVPSLLWGWAVPDKMQHFTKCYTGPRSLKSSVIRSSSRLLCKR